ncbi:MAG: RNA polymerase factor sigma-54, partial [bacterium]
LENPVLDEGVEERAEVADGEMPEAPENLPDGETDERGEVEIDWENIVQDGYDLPSLGPPLGDNDFPSYEQTLARPESLHEHLEWQLNVSASREEIRRLAGEIVWSIDDSGYLRADLAELAERDNLGAAEAEEALALVQDFDPPGVGARDLQECLLLQLKSLAAASGDAERNGEEGSDLALAQSLVRGHIDRLEERNYARLARQHGVALEEIVAAARLIRTLDPNPGARFSQERVEVAVPDVTVYKRGEDYEVVLNDDGLPPLRISPHYGAMAADRESTSPEARRYIEDRVRAAVWFLKSIEQRRQTILKVSRSIVSFQREFLDHGVSHLRPLVLRDVAEDIEMHESTVSRVTTGKYMETPQGVFNFKYFFHSGLGSVGGGNTSSVLVKEKIRTLIDEEDKRKPFTDQQVVDRLHESEVIIARRTVTKYRKELRIPSASRRRQFH